VPGDLREDEHRKRPRRVLDEEVAVRDPPVEDLLGEAVVVAHVAEHLRVAEVHPRERERQRQQRDAAHDGTPRGHDLILAPGAAGGRRFRL
jgi:hypothetical protein